LMTNHVHLLLTPQCSGATSVLMQLRLNFQVQRPHIGPLPCPEPINT
jgi:REP element-mobilizing transposase RayT